MTPDTRGPSVRTLEKRVDKALDELVHRVRALEDAIHGERRDQRGKVLTNSVLALLKTQCTMLRRKVQTVREARQDAA